MWYELTPAPGMAGDQIEFLKRAQRAAGALGLCDRPNITDPPTWDEGCLIVATLQRRWVFVADRYGRSAVDRLARACGSTAAESDAPEILSEPLKWAHAYVPSGATLNRTAQDDESGGGDLRLAPPENGLIALNVRRIGHWEDDRLTDWLADEFNTQPDSSKLRRTGVSAARIMAATHDMRESQDAAKQAAAALDLGFTNLAAHPSHPGLGAVLLSILLELLLVALAVPLLWWTALSGLPVLGWAVWRKASMGPDAGPDGASPASLVDGPHPRRPLVRPEDPLHGRRAHVRRQTPHPRVRLPALHVPPAGRRAGGLRHASGGQRGGEHAADPPSACARGHGRPAGRIRPRVPPRPPVVHGPLRRRRPAGRAGRRQVEQHARHRHPRRPHAEARRRDGHVRVEGRRLHPDPPPRRRPACASSTAWTRPPR